ncbi:MAG: hypothetical protein KDE55_10500 [Novosphingobium sp.]|nr:hypothetical protein [Novosphingobium sp.]
MRVRNSTLAGSARGALAAIALASAVPSLAQSSGSVSDFSLPPQPTATPRPVEGPVDAQNPVIVPAQPTPVPTAAPTSPASPSPSPAATPVRREPQPQPQPDRAPAARTTPSSPPAAEPSRPAPLQEPEAEPEAGNTAPVIEEQGPAPDPVSPPLAHPGEDNTIPWWALGGGLIAILLIGGLFWLSRGRNARTDAVATEPVTATPALPEPEARPARPEPVAEVPSSAPLPEPALSLPLLDFSFEPQNMRLSLVYATLAYRLALGNASAGDIGTVSISADMIAAHATLNRREQLDPHEAALPVVHEIPELAAGAAVTVAGTLQLPLAEVRVVRMGGAQTFLPLVRFMIRTATSREVRIFTLGEAGEAADGAMTAFRLDLGPRLFRTPATREIEPERWLSLDPAA